MFSNVNITAEEVKKLATNNALSVDGIVKSLLIMAVL